jgi:hypothetical protein
MQAQLLAMKMLLLLPTMMTIERYFASMTCPVRVHRALRIAESRVRMSAKIISLRLQTTAFTNDFNDTTGEGYYTVSALPMLDVYVPHQSNCISTRTHTRTQINYSLKDINASVGRAHNFDIQSLAVREKAKN